MNTNKTIEEMLPKKKEMSIQMTSSSGESSSYNVPNTEYNQAIDDVLLALPAIKQAIYNDIKARVEALKEATRVETGSFKYDFCYDEVLGLLDKE